MIYIVNTKVDFYALWYGFYACLMVVRLGDFQYCYSIIICSNSRRPSATPSGKPNPAQARTHNVFGKVRQDSSNFLLNDI